MSGPGARPDAHGHGAARKPAATPSVDVHIAWAIEFVDQLADEGVRHAVICPGSRSTPLALALDAHPDVTTTVHIDERGAAFFALGIARSVGRPVAVLTTSGTAVANLLPACAEAHQDNVPLLLLTADRPPRLRGSGANQTMDQVGVFSHFLRFEADLPVPDPGEVPHMLATLQEAVRRATAWPPGPAHLNQPFDKPLEPGAEGIGALRRLRRQAPRHPATPLIAAPSGPLPDPGPMVGARGLIVCGPGTGAHLAELVSRVAARLQAPVVADALSGVRFGHGSLAAHDLFLGAPDADALRPAFVLQFGRSPTSNALRSFLGRAAAYGMPRFRFDHSGRGWDDIGPVTFVRADPEKWLHRLLAAPAQGRSDAWLDAWQAVDARARSIARDALARAPDVEANWVAPVLEHTQRLFVGNSLPVRDLERFGTATRAVAVAANRGVSGIDGTIATAAGWALGGPCIAVIGDVAFQHDIGSLPLLPPHLRLLVVRNGGGRIFSHLPIHGATDRFDRLFLTPPQVDIPAACAAFGLRATVTAPSGLRTALAGPEQVIVLDVDGQRSASWRQQMEAQAHRELAPLLGVPG